MLSKRMTAKSLEAKPEIQASKRTVKVMRELKPAAFVSVEDFICLVVDLLSGNMTFALADDVEDDDEEDDEGNCCCCCCCCDDDDDDDLFGNMFSRWPASATSALKYATHRIYIRVLSILTTWHVRHMCLQNTRGPVREARLSRAGRNELSNVSLHT
ncbi:hypothetical protein ALC57_08917 [Trachymyrmex cornetzi]|uniref:Uncharacterized protein n=1 Tax=Trachymyrmex cornetzi TaxID=471704 RepID=A0A151J6B7_9HYME|nr:hypothetical protein ALC57_08917 [Trachymyrmex cornetzi]